ncbi:MAG: NrdH-redoxin [Candidatus Magasanikbacteria bacterium RIFOXYC2_FULL_40_16]|uniref:NrdH-redoxin n=3 Tax=Candidatus Magasanikiibacteriota TaxID=1752731 RepID=A0A1F6NJQ7_9BACT|nr:MAG: NrdH-redoxin [Candidatus Magasanikbacteria bacterium RIFOXYA2_FULL_40_20]OGH83990.1 MAG: NrdH-redoxin [Candidatus Magasanikbacteria bacterium RIFOXYB1_FULL_40_15]OGH86642.1 MAG: NrdH-redoxin [Candidatus Magasanikbacteria bacterium RIFOXYB2_FULL_40_13]OGH87113.1 MAG: NrdH-redoxin [Candidatus Magasanikbacteria bacterium RIFOXYA1_FULL_40_8]OGH90125.1 MAG: NrdH-redoxin [Candidatus Magasanikbacteria bacterium RIFOXYC2_FULL_40_16]
MKVEIYSTESCPYCFKAKDYLKEKKVRYIEYNVAEDHKRAKEMMEKSGQMGVPVIVVDDEVIIGFDKEKIDEAIGR